MHPSRLYTTDLEVDERLVPFLVTRAELMPIVHQVVAARADAVEDDPVTAEGQFAYIYGTRHVRGIFRRKKYLLDRVNNVEAVKHPDRNLKIVYQSVDLAAAVEHDPQAVSGKGSGADRLINLAQGSLFPRKQLERPDLIAPVNKGVWFFCVSVVGDDVRAELSLPSAIENNNFNGFIERIFIVRGGEWPKLKIAPKPADVAEFEPKVTRRK